MGCSLFVLFTLQCHRLHSQLSYGTECVVSISFKKANRNKRRNKMICFKHTTDNDTVSTYQAFSVQLVTNKKLEGFNKPKLRQSHLCKHSLEPLASCWSPTALKRPDRSKHCHCLQFAQSAFLASCTSEMICF